MSPPVDTGGSDFIQVGLTTRKHAVLFALRNLKSPVTVPDVARWLDCNPNGISMLVDRMVKDGLLTVSKICLTAVL
jgi:DNA-binding MarR family transcriptional regulator